MKYYINQKNVDSTTFHKQLKQSIADNINKGLNHTLCPFKCYRIDWDLICKGEKITIGGMLYYVR